MPQIYTRNSYNAIFVQPMTYCRLDCKGCYMHRYANDNKCRMETPIWISYFLKSIIQTREIECNQLTISLNGYQNLVPDLDRILTYMPLRTERGKMSGTFLPEIHFTINLGTIQYLMHGHNEILNSLFRVADSISVSVDDYKFGTSSFNSMVLRELDEALGYIKRRRREGCSVIELPLFNCNLLITPQVYHKFKDPWNFKQLSNLFDSIYLMAHKPVHGEPYLREHIESIRNTIKFFNDLPTEEKKKVNIDNCVKLCSSSANYCCSAGINMITVWPDGNVTGCPYATKPLESLQGLVERENPEAMAAQVVCAIKGIDKGMSALTQFDNCQMRDLWKKIEK